MTQGLFISQPGWSAAELDVAPPTYSAETFTPSADDLTHYAVAQELLAWGNAAGRAWSGSVTFTLVGLVEDAPLWGLSVRTDTASVVWTPNAAMTSLMNWSTTTNATIQSTAGVTGSVRVPVGVLNWSRVSEGRGVRSRGGSWMSPQQSAAPARAAAVFDVNRSELEAWRAALDGCSSPRKAYVYHHADETWREVHLGKLDEPTRLHFDAWRVSAALYEVR